MKKSLKFIIINLILVATLVILTGGVGYAVGLDVSFVAKKDSNNKVQSYEFKVLKDGAALSLMELSEWKFDIENENYNKKIAFDIINFSLGGNAAENVPQEAWSDFFTSENSNLDFSYDVANKTIIIKPKELSDKWDIISDVKFSITDKDENNYSVEKSYAIDVPSNLEFTAIPYFKKDEEKVYYKIYISEGEFYELGDIAFYHGFTSFGASGTFGGKSIDTKSLNINLTHRQEITIKSKNGTQVFGKFTVPDIKKVIVEQKDIDSGNPDLFFKKVSSTNVESVMTKQDFVNIGWKSVTLKNKSSDNTYTFDFQNVGGEMNLSENGSYEVTVYSILNEVVYSTTVYPIDRSMFTCKIGRKNEYYTLEYDNSLDELVIANAGKKFYIDILDMDGNKIPRNTIDSGYRGDGGNSKLQVFGSDLPLHLSEYDRVKINIYCNETNLDVEIISDVPKPDKIENLYCKITAPGTLELYSQTTGNEVTTEELYIILGYHQGNESLTKIELTYDSNGLRGLDTVEELNRHGSTSKLEFSNLTDVEDDYFWTADELETMMDMNSFKKVLRFYNYYKAVVSNGDRPLFARVVDANGVSHTLEVKQPESGINPWFEAITGIKVEEFEEYAELFANHLRGRADEVGDDGILEISANETSKMFYLNNDGVYYVTIDNGSGVNSLANISIPTWNEVNNGPRLAWAGRLTGAVKNAYPVGEYVSYNSSAITYTSDGTKANCYPLIGGNIYCVANTFGQDVTVRFERLDINGDGSSYELVEILDDFSNELNFELQSRAEGYTLVKVGYILKDKSTFFESLGKMLARFVRSLANGLNFLIQMAIQSSSDGDISYTVDIDKIIFNDYPDTSIAFFNSNNGGNNPSKMIRLFREAVNKWYSLFRGIAIAGYLVILLYIGVRILLSVGTQRQAKYKELLVSWVMGIVLLTFFPYVIKVAIDINDSLVAMVKSAKTEALEVADVRSYIDMSNFSLPTVADEGNYEAIAQQMDENPFGDEDTSYMAVIARKAHKSENLVDAVVYLIMVWQFIMIIIVYYKRVFTIAFLVAIFPFVTLSYAIDKVGDGKAQAFNTWTKELIANIFLQSIHAIIYIFVIGATYVEGEYSGDWLLSIIGITFLFKGEEIFKKIIGQGSGDTVKSLAQTAKRTVATVTAAKLVTKNVADNFIGAKSHVGKSINMYREWRKETKIANNFDFLTKSPQRVPAGNTLRNYNSSYSHDALYNQLADDIQTVNNGDLVDAETYGAALDNILVNRRNLDPAVKDLMKNLKFSRAELDELARTQASVVSKLASNIGVDKRRPEYARLKEEIDAELEAKIKIVIPGDDNNPVIQRKRQFMKNAMYYRIKNGSEDEKHKYRELDRTRVNREFNDADKKKNDFYSPSKAYTNGITNPFRSDLEQPLQPSTIAYRDSVVNMYFNKSASNATTEELKFAESVAIVKDVSNLSNVSGTTKMHSAKRVMQATKYLADHEHETKQYATAVKSSLGVSGKEAMSIMSEEVGRQYSETYGRGSYQFRDVPPDRVRVDVKDMPTGLTRDQEDTITNDVTEALNMALNEIKTEDEKAPTRVCYTETINGAVDVKDSLREDRESTSKTRADFVDGVIHERRRENATEIAFVDDFVSEQIEDMVEISNAPTYEGLTEEEHRKLADDIKWKFVEESTRAGTTMTTSTLGAVIGAGLNIGLSDDESAASEALTGAAAGVLAGDHLAENAIGRDNETKKLKILNPYTGEVEEFEVKRQGMTGDIRLWAEIQDIDDPIRYDDERLQAFNYNLDRQYLEHKRTKAKKFESESKKRLFDDALRNNRP